MHAPYLAAGLVHSAAEWSAIQRREVDRDARVVEVICPGGFLACYSARQVGEAVPTLFVH